MRGGDRGEADHVGVIAGDTSTVDDHVDDFSNPSPSPAASTSPTPITSTLTITSTKQTSA